VRAAVLDQVVTGADGAFSMPAQLDVAGPILCTTTGGTDGSLPAPALALVLPVGISAGNTLTAHITPFTTIAYNRLRAGGDFSTTHVLTASRELAQSLGLAGDLWSAAYGGTGPDDQVVTRLLDAFDAATLAVAGPGGNLIAAAATLMDALDRDTADGTLDGLSGGADVTVNGTPLADVAPDLVTPPDAPPPDNVAPVADAGPDLTVTTGTPVTLDGSASADPDGDALAYQWQATSVPAGAAATLSSPTVPRPGFTPAMPGVYVFTLTVNDGVNVSAPDSVQVTATDPANHAPVADAGPDRTAVVGEALTLDGSASADPDGDAITYLWQVTDRPAGSIAALTLATTASPAFTPDVAGMYVLSLTVSDGALDSAPDPVQVSADAPADLPPVADAGPDQGVAVWTPVTLDGTASRDPEGAALAFTWAFTALPAGSAAALSAPTDPAPAFTPDVEGIYGLTLTVNDGTQDSAPDTVQVTASAPVPNPSQYTFEGLAPGDWLGYAVAGPGDVDGDGHADVLTGAFRAASQAGQIILFNGSDGTVRYALSGQAAGDYFGRALAGAGDVDGDGRPDLIVGAPGASVSAAGAGRVRVIRGADGLTLYAFDGASAGDALGSAVAGAGDVNGDGYADVLVGAPGAGGNQGLAEVYSGFNGAVLHELAGQAAGERLGAAVAGAGDVDGDGFDDVAVGVPGSAQAGPGAGVVRLVSGATGADIRILTGPEPYGAFGSAVAGVGDVDGDGRPDLAVGTPNFSGLAPNAGRVDVFGADGAVLRTWSGSATQDQFGFSVAGAGDFNNDGRADVIVGVIGADAGGTSAGQAQVLSGADGSVLATLDGAAAYDGLGRSVAGVGDVDGDGRADVVAGAPGGDAAGTDAGEARVVLGGP
jgi:hypothetical protein